MNKALARIFFLLPVVAGLLVAIGVFSSHPAWPQPAQVYSSWYVSQPMPVVFYVLNRLALLCLIATAVSTIGLLYFWPPARYIYLISVLVALVGDFVDAPVLVGGWELFFEDIRHLGIGLNLALIFTDVCHIHFFPNSPRKQDRLD